MKKILTGRENRVEKRKNFIEHNPDSSGFLGLTINIPGSRKNTDFAKNLLREAVRVICKKLLKENIYIADTDVFKNEAGPFFLAAVNSNPEKIKKIVIKIENNHPLGRLFDIDIYDRYNQAVSRTRLGFSPRKCFICDNPARVCIRSKAHKWVELMDEIVEYRKQYNPELEQFREEMVDIVQNLAYSAILKEVFTTPKPGLVDLQGSGSHQDMDFSMFIESSRAIKPFFRKFFQAGFRIDYKGEKLLDKLKEIGLRAENEMFATTKGVNTQKGIIFSFGLLLGALGKVYTEGKLYFSNSLPQILCDRVAKLTSGLVYRELEREAKATVNGSNYNLEKISLTHGQEIFMKYGISGARGEAESGFSSVLNVGLPILRETLQEGFSWNEASIQTLLALMAEVDDSNILYRSDINTLKKVKKQAGETVKKGGIKNKKGRNEFFKLIKFVERKNISPGGSADLLAVTHFLYLLETKLKDKIG